MNETSASPLQEICSQLAGHRLPHWAELPDLELYMDQVLSLIGRYLRDYPGFDEKGLTASMVNNYVKMGALPPPEKKRYTREHLAKLLVICILKASLPISAIQRLWEDGLQHQPEDALYDDFCRMFQQTNTAAAQIHERAQELAGSSVCQAALLAQAEQALALRLYTALFAAPEPPKA